MTTVVWVCAWWASLAAVLGWVVGVAVTSGATPAPDYVIPAGEACRGEYLPPDDDMIRALTEGGTR